MLRRVVVAAALVLVAQPAFANVGPRSYGGQLTGEPHGIIDLDIEREDLVIDLRPLATRDGRVRVAATYHIENRGKTAPLDLVFASGATQLHDFRVTLDGTPIHSQLGWSGTLPTTWRAPTSTPLPDGSELSFTLDRDRGAATFHLLVESGTHDLAITYGADALLHHTDRPVVVRQFAYVLSPARAWTSFGTLAVTLHVPPDWTTAVTPPLTRTGDTLEGTFANVPADALAITVYAPSHGHSITRILGVILLAIATIGGGWLVARLTYRRERRRASLAKLAALVALGLAALWSALVAVAGTVAIVGPSWVLPADQADHHGYGDAFALLLLVVFTLVVFVIGLVLGFAAGHRGYKDGLPEPTMEAIV